MNRLEEIGTYWPYALLFAFIAVVCPAVLIAALIVLKGLIIFGLGYITGKIIRATFERSKS